MTFTFGIITDGENPAMLNTVISSIEAQGIPKYEIIVIGNTGIKRDHTRVVPFDESKHSKWITRKKNLITSLAKFYNIVYLHDYVALCAGWYNGFRRYGGEWDVCLNNIVNYDGTRFRDWCLDPGVELPEHRRRERLLPHDFTDSSKMYVSGAYWVAKKDVMVDVPLDEELCWGEGEDVEWSRMVRQKYEFSFNPHSRVRFLKQKWVSFMETGEDIVEGL